MAYNRSYPYVDPYRYNADWLLFEMKALQEKWEKFLEDFYKELETWKDGVEADINNFKTTMENAFNTFKENVNTIITGFEQEITEKQTAFETKITNQQTAFENNIQTQQEEFETLINNSITSIRNEWAAYQTNINNIVNSVKNLPNEWDEYKTRVDKEIADMTEYINNYFNNLDISAELDRIIDNKVEDGTLTPVIQDALNNEINARQNQHVLIVGDDPNLLTSATMSQYLQLSLRTAYPASTVEQIFEGFYQNNKAWDSVKKYKAQGKPCTCILVNIREIPASYTATNINNLDAAIQKEYPNARIYYLFTYPIKSIDGRKKMYDFMYVFIRNVLNRVFDLSPLVASPLYYGIGTESGWMANLKYPILNIILNGSLENFVRQLKATVYSSSQTPVSETVLFYTMTNNYIYMQLADNLNLRKATGLGGLENGYALMNIKKADLPWLFYENRYPAFFYKPYTTNEGPYPIYGSFYLTVDFSDTTFVTFYIAGLKRTIEESTTVSNEIWIGMDAMIPIAPIVF